MSLNEQQLKLVFAHDDRIVCLAAAGSGKTYSVISRISALVKQGVDPKSILALTFTRAAALEMRERYLKENEGSSCPDFRTFHSYCYHLISTDGSVRQKLGYRSIPAVASDEDAKKAMTKAKLQTNLKLSKKKLENPDNLTPKERFEYEIYLKNVKRIMRAENIITFDELCKNVCHLFVSDDECIQKYKNSIKHIIVDEFQDTDPTQFDFVNSFKTASIVVVGDILQSIYSFRGATSKIMKNLIDDPEWEVIKLYKNYRSCKSVCKYANKNTTYAEERYRLSLDPVRECEGAVEHEYIKDSDRGYLSDPVPQNELDNIIFTMSKKRGNKAILARSNKEVTHIRQYFSTKGIEFVTSKRNEDAERFLHAISDNDYLIAWASTQMSSEKYSEYIRLTCVDDPEDKLRHFCKHFGNIPVIKYILDTTFAIRKIFKSFDPDTYITQKAYMILDVLAIKNDRIDLDIHTDVELIEYLKEYIQKDSESDVYVGTIHSVKGLEFDNVFLVGVDGHSFPLMNEDNYNLFYVGITRARDYLKVYEHV